MDTLVIFRKTKDAEPMGEYKPTSLDARKKEVDFLLTSVNPYYIKWRSGDLQKVTKRELVKLQATHSWTTDF